MSSTQGNTVLPFAGLKSLDHGQGYLTAVLGFKRETMEYFGAGYCSKGLMRGCIAIPIHNRAGELLAYAGRSLADEEELYKYPSNFRKELELYNLHCALGSPQLLRDGLIVVADFFDVFRLYEAGYENAVALLGIPLHTTHKA